jgi:hypothetical protein
MNLDNTPSNNHRYSILSSRKYMKITDEESNGISHDEYLIASRRYDYNKDRDIFLDGIKIGRQLAEKEISNNIQWMKMNHEHKLKIATEEYEKDIKQHKKEQQNYIRSIMITILINNRIGVII